MSKLLSISQFSELSGKDRRTCAARTAHLTSVKGKGNALLIDAVAGFNAIFAPDRSASSLDEAKRRQADSAAHVNELRAEELQKTRIPIGIVLQLWDASLQSFGATLKAAKGKVLTPEKINELLDKLRTSKLPTPWGEAGA